MDITTKLTIAAEQLFDRHGYMGTGMDLMTAAAGMSSRTLYKHAGSKAELMARVLAERHRRFMAQMNVESVDALFAALWDWILIEGMRGCLFLRTLAETGGDIPEIYKAVAAHKAAFLQLIGDIVSAELGHADPAVTDQVLILYEGATHAAVYREGEAVLAARSAAAVVLKAARR